MQVHFIFLVFNALSTYLLLLGLVMISIGDICMCITKKDGFLLCDQSKLPNQSIFYHSYLVK
jgi:hypothetical protein